MKNAHYHASLVEKHVEDFGRIRIFYESFGLQVVWMREPEGFKGYMVMKDNYNTICFWGGNEAIYNHPYFGNFGPKKERGLGVEIVFMTDHLESMYDVAKKQNCVVEELTSQPWGLRDFRIVDPQGYYSRWTTPHVVLNKKYAVK